MPSVDVVIPSYQYGRYLRSCVESVLSQGIADLRILIIDNASTDNSVEVARELVAEDRRVELIARPRNLGRYASYNEGIDWASSDYFLMLCADDLLMPGALSSAISIMEQNPEVVFAIGEDQRILESEGLPAVHHPSADLQWTISTGRRFIERCCSKPRASVAPIMRTSAQKAAGYHRANLPFNDDVELLLRLACLGSAAETRSSLAIQRLHADNHSRSFWERPVSQYKANEEMFQSFFSNEGASLPDAERLHRRAIRNISARAYWAAMAQFCRGEATTSLVLLRFALARHPTMAVVPPMGHFFQLDSSFSRAGRALASALGLCRRAA
jgi:glycosyltransferase involved in cell wall biosynthesis